MAGFGTLLAAAAATAGVRTASGGATLIDAELRSARFDGIGGVSGGGGGTRLLYDYDDPARSAILDLLFEPKHGAALHSSDAQGGAARTAWVASADKGLKQARSHVLGSARRQRT